MPYVGLPALAARRSPVNSPDALAAGDRANIAWLQDQSTPLPDTDWDAASSNFALGVPGSQFGDNRRLVLRDAERRDRMEQANQMLNPYLEREQQTRMQREQLEAEAARQLISEAGLDRRLTAEQAARLELALLEGNQQAARQLVSEGGLNSRQAAALQAQMDQARMTTGAGLLQTLIQTSARTGGGGGGGTTVGRPGVAMQPSYRWQTDTAGNVTGGEPPPASYYNQNRVGGGGGVSPVIASDVNRILQQYGLTGAGVGANIHSYF
jgi:hypothetical protein